MSFIDEIKTLTEQRKWYEFAKMIENSLPNNLSSSDIDAALSLLGKNIARIHPLSLRQVIIGFFPHIQAGVFIEMTETAINTINFASVDKNEHAQLITTLELYKCLALINQKKYDEIESKIIAFKASKLSNENVNLLYLVAALFYESIGNYDEAQEYLFSHANHTNSVYNIEKLVVLSILSTSFFDFAAISSFEEFESMSNQELKRLFMCFRDGNINQITPNEILEILGIDSIHHILDKVYLLNLVKICFNSNTKFVRFDQLQAELCVDEITLIKLLLRALGLNIINGWIDSEQKMLFFNSVIPRALEDNELTRMKSKFIEWRSKIQNVIEVIDNS